MLSMFLDGAPLLLKIRLVRSALGLMGSSSVDYLVCVVAGYCIRRLVASAAAAGNTSSLSGGLIIW